MQMSTRSAESKSRNILHVYNVNCILKT